MKSFGHGNDTAGTGKLGGTVTLCVNTTLEFRFQVFMSPRLGFQHPFC